MRKERHIYFDEEIYQAISDYSLNKKQSINKVVHTLIELGLEADKNVELVIELKEMINKIEKNSYLTFLLLKQLYSDLAFPTITDVYKSESLNKFFRNIKGNKYND